MIGADISAIRSFEDANVVYLENGRAKGLFVILKDNGFNTIRLRLFVDPDNKWGAINDLPYPLDLAKRTKSHDMKLLLNFHYSDTWADPKRQTKPAAWKDMSFDELKQTVQSYTASVIDAFKKESVLPDMVQVGNEITPGMLWPDGKVGAEYDNPAQWEKFTSLIKAGITGVRQASGDPNLKIMIHIDQGGKKSVSKWFFENINKHQVEYDVIGVSYYPWWHGTFEDLKENLSYIATELEKDVIVVETAYHHDRNRWNKDVNDPPFPYTPQGQYNFLYELTKTVLETPQGRGIGVCYWHPESVPVSGRAWMGGAAALFDSQGNVLPGVGAFADAASGKPRTNCKPVGIIEKKGETSAAKNGK